MRPVTDQHSDLTPINDLDRNIFHLCTRWSCLGLVDT